MIMSMPIRTCGVGSHSIQLPNVGGGENGRVDAEIRYVNADEIQGQMS